MRDTTHMPLFPSAEQPRPLAGSGLHARQSHRRQPAPSQGIVVATAVRRLIAGAVFGLVMVGMLWYLMQFNQQTSALTAAASEAPVPQGVVLVTVNGGDSLWAISAPHRPAWVGQEQWVQEVAAYNEISADAVFPGQVLAIPTYETI